jgi:hypothetical protein
VPPTATRTNTPVPPPTATRTNTPVPPTATRTNTPVPPTATRTNTPVPPTATRTPTPSGPGEAGVNTPTPDRDQFIQERLDALRAAINRWKWSSYTKQALLSRVKTIEKKIDAGDYCGAIWKLEDMAAKMEHKASKYPEKRDLAGIISALSLSLANYLRQEADCDKDHKPTKTPTVTKTPTKTKTPTAVGDGKSKPTKTPTKTPTAKSGGSDKSKATPTKTKTKTPTPKKGGR